MRTSEKVVPCPCCRAPLVLRITDEPARGRIMAEVMTPEYAAKNPLAAPPAPASVETTP